jgi:hypothetical protein
LGPSAAKTPVAGSAAAKSVTLNVLTKVEYVDVKMIPRMIGFLY